MITKLVKKGLRPIVRATLRRLYKMGERYEQENLPAFATRPKNLTISLPRRIAGAERMEIGDDVVLGPGCLLVVVERYPSPVLQHPARPRPLQTFTPRIAIGHRVSATSNLTVAAHQEVVIEDDVLFASNINITDGLHGYANADEPYKYQPIFRVAPIRVGRGSWIGQNVVILPGVSIGELAIIGANSVVTHSIPPRCIAVGSPARVIKQWQEERQCWITVDMESNGRARRRRV